MRTIIISDRTSFDNLELSEDEKKKVEVIGWKSHPTYDLEAYNLIILDVIEPKDFSDVFYKLSPISLGDLLSYSRTIVLILSAKWIVSRLSQDSESFPLTLRGRQMRFRITNRPTDAIKLAEIIPPYVKEYHKKLKKYDFTISNVSFPSFQSFVTTNIDNRTLSSTFKVNDANLIILPFDGEPLLNATMIYKLGKSFLQPQTQQLQLSPILDEKIKIKDEEKVIEELNQLEKRLTDKKILKQQYSNLKEILALDGDELRDRVLILFQEIGIKTRKNDVGEEDFELLDEQNKLFAICEVKGIKNNISRNEIHKLVGHRISRNLPDEFPSILITNTFKEAQNMNEKDIPIDGNTIKFAVNNNTIVTRTLDLIHILNAIYEDKTKLSKLIEIIKSKHGWLTVQNNEIIIIK